jgi:hypothetical protein
LWAGKKGRFESDDTLASLCTSDCTNALANWARRINGACGNSFINETNGDQIAPQYFVEDITEGYNELCFKNKLIMTY